MTPEQTLQLQLTKKAVQDWRDEEARAADGISASRANAVLSIRNSADAGIPQVAIAEACGWPRQRVNQLLNETR